MGLDIVELVLKTEETFSVDLPDEECEAVRTVSDLYRLVLSKIQLSYITGAEVERGSLGEIRSFSKVSQQRDWTASDVWRTLKALIEEQLGVRPTKIVEEARFVDDLGMD